MRNSGHHPATIHPKVVLFDGVCNLCNGFVQFIIRHDKSGQIKFSQLQSTSGQSLLKPFSASIEKADSVIYIREGKIHLRSSAGLYILKDLGGVWKTATVFFIFPKPIRDFVYDIIAKYRYRWFGKRESCMVPTDELVERFI